VRHCIVSDVDLFLHQQGLDTSTTASKAMFQMLGVFAEFERGIIRERIVAAPPPFPTRDFVPWRFSAAGRRSAWIASSCRHPKTYTEAVIF